MKRSNVPNKERSPTQPAIQKSNGLIKQDAIFTILESGYVEETPTKLSKLTKVPSSKIDLQNVSLHITEPENITEPLNLDQRDKSITETPSRQQAFRQKPRNTVNLPEKRTFAQLDTNTQEPARIIHGKTPGTQNQMMKIQKSLKLLG